MKQIQNVILGASQGPNMPPIDPRWAKAKRFPVHAAVDRYPCCFKFVQRIIGYADHVLRIYIGV